MRTFKVALTITSAALLLSACQMTVSIATRLDASGAGSFSIGMHLDKELRDQLESAPDATEGMGAIQSLFDGLAAKGWRTVRAEPQGGVSFDATRDFADSAGFDAALAELRTARGGGTDQFGSIKFNLGFETHRSFLRTRSAFKGEFDTSAGPSIDKDLLKALQDLVRFEVRAELPGATTIADGNGTISGGAAVWRPELGTRLSFAATSSATRPSSLLMLIIPLLGIIAAGAWFVIGRRHPQGPLKAIELDDGQ